MPEALPRHLKKYICEQDYEKYTPVDQACWRFILRQLKDYLGKNAHSSYLEGLEKTGITINQIPRIHDISKKLEAYGWRALPVSGFIPPAAFMEMQALGILPIASDMRSLGHLMYTPAPDIVHEAAGHAPMLINPEFSDYLRQYSQVARKAIISHEDLEVYEAIRNLSDIKENPNSTDEQIAAAQRTLDKVTQSVTHVSEAAILSRMNWWTAEYGLIGDLNNPKIFGAGLLSSVGEARSCLSAKVKKIPLTVDCIKLSYDITEPQPQLFVTPNFKHLSKVLEDMANTMAFRVGGAVGLNKAIESKTVNTVEFNSGVQISGQLTESVLGPDKNPAYLKFKGPCQLSYHDHEIDGHDRVYHGHGFGTPVGFTKQFPNQCLSQLSEADLTRFDFHRGHQVKIEFSSGVTVEGSFRGALHKGGRLVLLSFESCTVMMAGQKLFDPSWGTYDMAVGSKVTSVFGGPADRQAYGETEEDFVAKKVPPPRYSKDDLDRHDLYQKVRDLRERNLPGPGLEKSIGDILAEHMKRFPNDFLLLLECYELLLKHLPSAKQTEGLKQAIIEIADKAPDHKEIIMSGLLLAAT